MQWSGVKWTNYKPPPIVTSDFACLGLIGDRRLSENQFGKVQIDRTEEIRNWANKMKEVKQNERDVISLHTVHCGKQNNRHISTYDM